MRRAVALLGLLLLGGCGEAPAPTARALKQEGDRLAAEKRWVEAADFYGQAFATEDPLPTRSSARGFLALRRAVALENGGFPRDALAWLRWAERLDPTRRLVHFYRGRLLDGRHPATADPKAALLSYRRYLELADEAEEEVPFIETAKARIQSLE